MEQTAEAILHLGWYFVIYAFLGWCLEVSFHAVHIGKFINRGFLNGPVCPVYGFGMAVVIICLTPLNQNLLLLFAGSVILTSALEFLTGFVLEKLFHSRWWDYTDQPFNIKGYICLKFSLAWGIACVFVMRIIHPMIARLVGWIPPLVSWSLLAFFLLLFILDTAATVVSVRKLDQKLRLLHEIGKKIRAGSDSIGANISEDTLKLRQAREKLAAHAGRTERRVLKAFPRLHSHRYAEELEGLRERLRKRRER